VFDWRKVLAAICSGVSSKELARRNHFYVMRLGGFVKVREVPIEMG
jgi:hypothetical protein